MNNLKNIQWMKKFLNKSMVEKIEKKIEPIKKIQE